MTLRKVRLEAAACSAMNTEATSGPIEIRKDMFGTDSVINRCEHDPGVYTASLVSSAFLHGWGSRDFNSESS